MNQYSHLGGLLDHHRVLHGCFTGGRGPVKHLLRSVEAHLALWRPVRLDSVETRLECVENHSPLRIDKIIIDDKLIR